ncbi:MAG: T9SS type A sorting domain-containing protein, partial [Phycisphaerae bacterium]|nr:T9SS type A sorting domain-containing protein [Saprospiraceae bacterium]
DGNPVIAAYSRSANYPVQPNAAQKTYLGNYEGVITKISADGSTILASTYLGGSGSDGIEGIGIDAQNRIYVTGSTDSPGFSATTGTAYQPIIGGGTDGHLTVLSADLSTILYSTFIGGSANDNLRTCHVDEWGRVHAGGASGSANLPILNAFHPTLTGTNAGVAVTFQPNDLMLPGALCVLSNDFVDPCLSTAAIDLNGLEIYVFPNPATESISIESEFSDSLKWVEISGVNGQLIISKAIAGTSQKIDASSFPKGFYCLKIVSEFGIFSKKILLQ